jgi:ABC-2 type transport system ATP-binding protein
MIELKNVSKNFGAVQAVKDLSLHIPAGELFCFLGPNGAGKTTTIKMLCGLLKPAEGTIHIGGMDIRTHAVEARRITGYIPDFPFMYDRLSAAEFFEFTGDLHHVPRETVARELEDSFSMLGLMEYRHTLVRDLSHGLRQRLIYAVTMLHKPKVIFVDEPFIGLDPFSIRMIKDLLREKAREGVTVFLTTHILALIEDLAARIGIIVNGRLVAAGTMDELRAGHEIKGDRLEDIFFSLAT